MLGYVVRRLLHAVLVMVGLSLFIFFVVRLSGDPAVMMFAGGGQSSPEAIAKVRKALGLDQPFWIQYLHYMLGVLRGNLGTSFTNGQPVSLLISERLPNTVLLTVTSMIVAIVISVPAGIISAVRRGSVFDLAARIFSLFGISFPNFWLGIMFIIIFAVRLRWFPSSGFETWGSLVLPACTLGLILSSILARLIRSSMLDVLNAQYVTTARSKGLSERVVIFRHALRNAMIPTVTFIGLQFGQLLGGTVILEQVFAWPGMGRLALEAINRSDYPVIQGTVLVFAFFMIAVNLIVDLSYGFLDPRIRYGSEA